MLKLMIIDDDLQANKSLKQSLLDSNFSVVAHIAINKDLARVLGEFDSDVAVVDIKSLSEDILKAVVDINTHSPRPIVMFTQESDTQKIKAATHAGVSAYVVGVIPNERLAPVIDAAIARFEEFKHLRAELNLANAKLNERKIVERAKGILMKQRDLNEDESYNLLRTMAMKKNMKLADLSSQLVEAAKMLII
jgi:two-component system, response regulator / RNA-binding antiterminator